MSRYQMTSRSIWNFSSAQDFFFKKYQNCNLSFLKKHMSNEFQIEGDKSHEYPLRIYIHETFTSQNYRVVESVYIGYC